jgi:hypothetical protein
MELLIKSENIFQQIMSFSINQRRSVLQKQMISKQKVIAVGLNI